MTVPAVRAFIDALGRLEQDRDPGPITEVFAEDGRVGNILAPEEFTGRDGARKFWTEYRETFGSVQSSFRNVIVEDGLAALEWTTEGTTPSGGSIRYDGVSILEYEGERITRFRAYFNPAALGRQVEPVERSAGR